MDSGEHSFTRYLAAKRSVDDRALNRQVWQTLAENLPESWPSRPLRVLELGCGIGTMLARMLEWGLLDYARYTGIDSSAENIAAARNFMAAWAQEQGYLVGRAEPEKQWAAGRTAEVHAPAHDATALPAPSPVGLRGGPAILPARGLPTPAGGREVPAWPEASAAQAEIGEPSEPRSGLLLRKEAKEVAFDFQSIDLFDFIPRQAGRQSWDLIVAHAFLDLLDIPPALPQISRLAHPGTLFYFTLIFDGATLLEPCLEADFDALVESLYHRTMDERLTNANPSGGSRSGRHLFGHLRKAGAQVLAAGASDWVVFPGLQGYFGDEAYFLHFILHTIDGALAGHPGLEAARFQRWIAARHDQVERGELLYIAHQLDFVGRWAE